MKNLTVKDGQIVPAYGQDTGILIYRNDRFFRYAMEDFEKSRKNIVWGTIGFISVATFSLIRRFNIIELLLIIILVIGFIILRRSLNHVKEIDHGIVIYENGVDIFKGGTFELMRIFVPFVEVRELRHRRYSVKLMARHSKGSWPIGRLFIDDKGLRILEKMVKGYRLRREHPHLVVYTDDGKVVETITDSTDVLGPQS